MIDQLGAERKKFPFGGLLLEKIKKRSSNKSFVFLFVGRPDPLELGDRDLRSGNLAVAQTTGANCNGLGCTVNNCLYLADIGLPSSVRFTMRVGNCLSENNTFSADTALCHNDTSLYVQAAHRSFFKFFNNFHRTFDIIPYSKKKCKSFFEFFLKLFFFLFFDFPNTTCKDIAKGV